MDITILLVIYNTLLAALALFTLGLWMYFERHSQIKNEFFSAILFTTSLWLFSYVLWLAGSNTPQSLFWLRTLYFTASFLPVFFFFFVATFFSEKKFPLVLQLLSLLPNAVIFFVVYFTPFLANFSLKNGAVDFGDAKIALAVHYVLFTVISLGLLFYYSRKGRFADRGKLLSIFIGSVVAFDTLFVTLFGSYAFITSRMSWFGNLGNIALVAGMLVIAYVVDPKKFNIDIRPVSTELFFVISFFVVIIDIVASQDFLNISIRLVVLMILVVYGSFTMNMLARELHRLREIQALHEQVVKINGRLIEADKLKTQFVSFASHQLRAPISGIRSYLDMLVKGDFGQLQDKQKEILGTTVEAMGRLNDTIETFLDVAKIELGKLELFKSETNIAVLIANAINDIAPLAKDKKLSIIINTPSDLPNVNCDSGKLFHVLSNLVHNAIKYTEKGTITISARREDDKFLVVEVQDTGTGLSDEDKKKIFDLLGGGFGAVKFEEAGGSGLGLFIVKNIIDAHMGTLIVTSLGKGKGSTFGFRIPLT